MLFTEVIKIENGVFYNLRYHKERVERTLAAFGCGGIDLSEVEKAVPDWCGNGLYKCRVVYSDKIEKIEFLPYTFRKIETVELVTDNSIEYQYKYADRSRLNALKAGSRCDDIIIVKDGFITDSSYTNLVFRRNNEYFTPIECLLPGTKRRLLLDAGIIKLKSIRVEELCQYDSVHFINAMTDLKDGVCCSVKAVVNVI